MASKGIAPTRDACVPAEMIQWRGGTRVDILPERGDVALWEGARDDLFSHVLTLDSVECNSTSNLTFIRLVRT